VDTTALGFAAALVMDRAQGSVRQEVLYAGLPDGVSLSLERWVARESVEVTSVTQGFLRIVNEKFGAMKDNCHGHRVVATPEGATRFEGFVSADPGSDVIRTYDHPAWINVDGRLGIVFRGSGETVYHNRHFFSPWWATADDLVLSRETGPRQVKAGSVFASLTALIAPGQSAKKTAAITLAVLSAQPGCVGLIGSGYLVAANFSPVVKPARLRARRPELRRVPVFEGRTRVTDQTVTYHLPLQPGQAVLRKAVCFVEVSGEIEIVASASAVIAKNTGRETAVVSTGRQSVKLRAGQLIQLR
jgi:hypothetical protein